MQGVRFMPTADERQLIVKAKEGDHEAFRGLVERYMKHAYNVAYSFVSHHDDAEDIAQESFVRVYQSLQSFRGDAEFTVLRETAMDVLSNFSKHDVLSLYVEIAKSDTNEDIQNAAID
jgi:RNA polymerase sigma-70 factor, ECF subfamily